MVGGQSGSFDYVRRLRSLMIILASADRIQFQLTKAALQNNYGLTAVHKWMISRNETQNPGIAPEVLESIDKFTIPSSMSSGRRASPAS